MSFRTSLLKTVEKLRRLPGPTAEKGRFDVYTSSVIIRTRTWSGGNVKLGNAVDADLSVLPRPKVREAEDGQALVVGPITPAHPKGGYTLAQLRPSDSAGVEYYYIVTGANGTHNYTLVDIDTSKPFGYMLRLRTLTRAAPF